MKKYKFIFLLCFFLLIGTYANAQSDCASIQCDCENVPDADKDPGLKALCEYYERSMIELCKNGEKGLKCHKIAKGPNAWQELKNNPKVTKSFNKQLKAAPAASSDNIDNLLTEIRNSENGLIKYEDLHKRLTALQESTSGLELAMKMSDYFMWINYANDNIEFAIKSISNTEKYSDYGWDFYLAYLIEPLKIIGDLEIDQLDMKFELANIFRNMENNGLDILSLIGEGNKYHDEQAVEFIKECYAIKTENSTKREMQELRDASNRIFLRKMDNLIPIAVKSELTDPIYYINKGMLDWNEKLVDESLNTLNVIADIVEKKKWDKKKMDRAYLNFKQVYSEELWPKDGYYPYFSTISKELPIVWELLEALFVK